MPMVDDLVATLPPSTGSSTVHHSRRQAKALMHPAMVEETVDLTVHS